MIQRSSDVQKATKQGNSNFFNVSFVVIVENTNV
jgi:hypothetical protein